MPKAFGVLHIVMIGIMILSPLLWGVNGLTYGWLFALIGLPMVAFALLRFQLPMMWQYEILVFLGSMSARGGKDGDR